MSRLFDIGGVGRRITDNMAGKKEKGSGIQQAAGLIRYFDEESEDAWKISKTQVYIACFVLGGGVYLLNHGVIQFIWGAISSLF